MQIICKVKKPSVSISSKLNVALVEAAPSKSRPPRVMVAQIALVPALGDRTQGAHPSAPPPGWVSHTQGRPRLGLLVLMQGRIGGKQSTLLEG